MLTEHLLSTSPDVDVEALKEQLLLPNPDLPAQVMSSPAFPTEALEPSSPTALVKVDMDLSDLPDLTPLLKEQGIYGEYVAWRDNYMRWRKGEARGAKGENTVADFEKRAEEFNVWYPTVRTYSFRRTIAFWCAATCCEGCLLSLWHSLAMTFPIGPERMMYDLTRVPNLLAGCCSVFGIYLSWFQMINIQNEVINTGKYHYVWFDYRVLEKNGIDRVSWIGMLFYVAGAMCFTWAKIADFGEWDAVWQSRLIDWPATAGGVFVLLGGGTGLIINEVFTTTPLCLVWWVAVLNAYAGFAFWLSSCSSIVTGHVATAVGASGTMTYLITAILGLCMWRGEQFGGAIIPALNRITTVAFAIGPTDSNGVQTLVTQVSGDKEEVLEALNPKLSWRGLLFLMVFVCIGAFQMISCCMTLSHHGDYLTNPHTFKLALNTFLSGAINTVIVHLSLALTSTTLTLPKMGDEPYRTCAIVMRGVAVVAFLNSLLTLKVQFETEEAVLS